MEAQEYSIVEDAQDDHWWWLGRQAVIELMIQRYCSVRSALRIADVGSGLGANIAMLRRYGEVTALEPSARAVAKISERWCSSGSVRALVWTCPQPLNEAFDLILLADVLEHIPDDAGAIDWIWRHLNPGGFAILTVPAHRHLWTEMDEVVHHCRRYRSAELRHLLSPKLVIRRFSFYNLTLYPVKLLFVAFLRLRRAVFPQRSKRSFNETPPRVINQIFKSILRAEARLIARISMPFGVSIVAVVQRPSKPLSD